jgi:glycosyltransferase involved in cell wall biosynthesis
MAHGVPVVTSRGTAMAEFVGDAGLLVDPHDEHRIAEAIQIAMGDRHDELAKAAREKSTEYSWDKAAELTVEAYREVAS